VVTTPITHPAARLLLGKANAPLRPKSMLVLLSPRWFHTAAAEVGTTDESIGLEGGNDANNSSLTGVRGRRKMVWQRLAAARNDGGGGDGARALLGQ